MTFSVGPITLRYLTQHNWSTSVTFTDVNILNSPQSSYGMGASLPSFSLAGEFNADTPTEARLQRKQINELLSNPSIQYVYIDFSSENEAELSGWYSIESLDTTIETAIFDTYPFTMTVKRANSSATMFQTWKSRPHNDIFTVTSLPWVAMPENRGSFNSQVRIGRDSIVTPIFADTLGGLLTAVYPNALPVAYSADFDPNDPLSGVNKYYTSRCYMYDTTTQSDVTTVNNDPSESTWVERFGTHFNWEGDVVFGNTLIRYIWSAAAQFPYYYLWTGANWEKICVGPLVSLSVSPTTVTFETPPIVTYFDWNKIEWYHILVSLGDETRTIPIKYTMLRGSYFVTISVKGDWSTVQSTSNLAKASANSFVSNDENIGTSNYRSAKVTTPLATGVQYGLSYVDGGATANTGSGTIRFGISKSAGEWIRLGLFLLEKPTTSGHVTPDLLSRQFLANMNFEERLVNVREFV